MSHQDKKKKTVTQRSNSLRIEEQTKTTSIPTGQNATNIRSKNNLRLEEQTKTTITPTGQNVMNIRRPNRSSTPAHKGMRRNVFPLNSPTSRLTFSSSRRNISPSRIDSIRSLYGRNPNIRLPSKFVFTNRSETTNVDPTQDTQDQAINPTEDTHLATGLLN